MPTMSQDLDFDIFNGAADVEPAEDDYADVESPIVDEEPTEEAPVEETPAEEEAPVVDEETAEEAPSEDDIDVDALVKELLGDSAEIEDKVEEIKDEVASTGNNELLSMIDELQTMLAEKNQTIEELNKKNEITSNRFMDAYGDAENYSFYKPTIEKLDNNPQLNMLVKNYDNESASQRVISILADMIKEKTGVDVNDAINAQQKSSVSNALTDIGGSGVSASPTVEEDDEIFNREQSLNTLF